MPVRKPGTMKCTEAAGRVKLTNQINRGGCGEFGRYAIQYEFEMVRFLSILGGLLTLASLVLHNANDLNRNYELSPRGRTVIQYGWP